MKIAVSFAYGEAWTISTIFFTKPSKRSSFDEDGWPSTYPLGFTTETAGNVPVTMSPYRSTVSWMCAFTWSGCDMIEVSYWKGLQMLQYSSASGPLVP